MTGALTLPAIPWAHSTDDFGSVWVWNTPHFLITVNGNDRSCYYTIADKTAAAPGSTKLLADGQASSFREAEMRIRGTIGKAYPPTLGYRNYAGPLATTFMLADGKETDLGPYVGNLVTVTVLDRDGSSQVLQGRAFVKHYELLIEQGAQTVRVTPSFISEINFTYKPKPSVGQTRLTRTVEGRVLPGCTGTPGFVEGTVEHFGRSCPLHEEVGS